jgi:hypothetical protein
MAKEGEKSYRKRVAAFPVDKANVHNTNVTGGDNFLGADLTADLPPALFRVQVAFTSAAKLQATIKKGGNAQAVYLNGNVNLAAGSLYIFDLLVHSGDSVNFKSDQTQSPLMVLRVQEIQFAGQ